MLDRIAQWRNGAGSLWISAGLKNASMRSSFRVARSDVQKCSGHFWLRNINEPMERQANFEDNCSGRFESQALLDEQALAACLAYVDLNPIRADMAKTPEMPDHTSIQRGIQSMKSDGRKNSLDEALFPFIGNPREPMPQGLPFRFDDYLELVGRSYASCVRGVIASMHVTGPGALFVMTNQVQFPTTFHRFSSA